MKNRMLASLLFLFSQTITLHPSVSAISAIKNFAATRTVTGAAAGAGAVYWLFHITNEDVTKQIAALQEMVQSEFQSCRQEFTAALNDLTAEVRRGNNERSEENKVLNQKLDLLLAAHLPQKTALGLQLTQTVTDNSEDPLVVTTDFVW